MLATIAAAASASCSSSSPPSIIGEWRANDEIASQNPHDLIFNADGTYGSIITPPGAAPACQDQGTYVVDGDVVKITSSGVPQTPPVSMPFSIAGNTLSLHVGDAGEVDQFTRVNDSGTNTCP
jgi:hypothetical protein